MHKVFMARNLLIVGMAVIPFTGLIAEEKPADDFEARKASVANLEGLKENLAARKEWLEKNTTAKSGP